MDNSSTSTDKSICHQQQNKQTQPDSITEVNPSEILVNQQKTRVRTHGVGCWGNPRVVMGIRVDSELKKQFTAVSKRIFGSTCNPIESFMAAIVATSQTGVNFGNTVNIEKIVIERNLRARRDLEAEVNPDSSVVKDVCVVCGRSAFGVVTRADDSRVFLCKIHYDVAKPKAKSWRVFDE